MNIHNQTERKNLEICFFILNFGRASDLVSFLYKRGLRCSTIFLGQGTAPNNLLRMLGLDEIRKEIIITLDEGAKLRKIAAEAAQHFKMNLPNKGIGFVCSVLNTGELISYEKRGENLMNYRALFTIVDKGKGHYVVEAAESAGSTGGTLIHGRGSANETATLFSFPIQPEKDIVLNIVPADKAADIIQTISETMRLDEDGKGIIFALDVVASYGLR